MAAPPSQISESKVFPPKPFWLVALQSTYVTAAVASSGASLVSTPAEVVKTRLQLQGELSSGGARVYGSAVSGFVRIVRREGASALYKGLVPAVWYQIVMNGTRLGSHRACKTLLRADDPALTHLQRALAALAAGALAGALGGFLASPLYLVKVRLQSAAHVDIAVGYQHAYSSASHALVQVWREGGVRALWAGASSQVLRVAVASAAQLATLDSTRGLLERHVDALKGRPYATTAASALVAGVAVALVMNPADVVSTRLYNQPRGQRYYAGLVDCFYRIWRHEGVAAFWKGTTANYLRLGPHTLATFVGWHFTTNSTQRLGRALGYD